MAIIALVFMWPTGIPALLNAVKVDSLHSAGDYAGADQASRRARMWSWWSFGLCAGGTFLWLVMMVLVAAAAGTSTVSV
jgi:hypothetical protein